MQIDINTTTYSIKQRILAFFMAFMIFSLTCPEIFEGLGVGLIVHATTYNAIHTGDKNGCMSGASASDSKYTYSGKIKTGDVTVFDYLTDNEILGQDIDLGARGGGYNDPYSAFNDTISRETTSTVLYPSTDNITIELQVLWCETLDQTPSNVKLKMWDENRNKLIEQLMNCVDSGYNSGSNYYYYTYRYTFNKKVFDKLNNARIDFIQFLYYNRAGTLTTLQKYNENNDSFLIKKSEDCGKKIVFNCYGNNIGTQAYYRGTDGTAENLYKTIYTNPLYLGMFYYSNNSSSYGNNLPLNAYGDFHWLTNMGLKNIGSTTGDDVEADNHNGYKYRGSAAVQGLVENKLTKDGALDTATSEGKLRQGTVELPYFSEDWAGDHPTLMRYYNKYDSKDKIAFPFYEVTTPLLGTGANANVPMKGSDTAKDGDYAKYYQFSSKDSNLYFSGNSTAHTGSFTESDTPINSSFDNVGFLPFNNSNSDHNKNNVGFGMKFEIPFTLQSDGCVGVTDSSGEYRDSNEYPERIHTTFEFKGDDDLWVFVDGHLILDMGGDHTEAHGTIDFYTGIASVEKAVTYTEDIKNNLGVALGSDNVPANSDDFRNNIPGYSNGTYDGRPHVMTIFYMERGMADSNLLIRYNYTPLNNFSKMKVQEITNFDNVNKGLLNATMKAAENDVFKYTAYNTGTLAADVATQSKVYPDNALRTRTNQGINTVLTIAGTGDPTNTPYNYSPPSSSSTEGVVKNTSYIWVDDFASMNHSTQGTGKTTNSASGDAGGSFFLMYGTKASSVGTTAKESSAEFGKQFSRYSLMRVKQVGYDNDDLYLYTPVRNGNNAVTFIQSARKIGDYYTSRVPYIFSNLDTSAENELSGNNAQFAFRNNIYPNRTLGSSTPDANEVVAVQMTEVFENTVKTADLEIKKTVTGNTNKTDFEFEIELSNVFGVSTATVTNHGALVSSKNGGAETTQNISGTDKGTFTLQKDGTLKISGIPVHTKYTITEKNDSRGDKVTGEVSNTEIKTNESGTTIEVTVNNEFQSETGVDVLKKNGSNTPLEGAEFELWYKETITPPTYAFNEPKLVPNQLNTMKVTATPSELGVPGLEIPESITTYKFKTTYTAPEVPDVSDKDWILPRNDTDYIYFRDYNVGDITGWEDSASFNDTSKSNANTNNDDGKRSWRGTEFATHTGHSQNLELFFDDNDTYWMAAEFSGNGKKTIKYAMWERFVDKYDKDSDGTEDVVTTVWKIQPPDGYTNVKFMMLSGDTVIRETQSIPYELGKIYHKTSWGKWTKRNNIDSYYDVPVETEGYWAPNSTANDAITDSRMSYTTYDGKMLQARKYEPTAQKVIFHCNSTNVWHNIHIEFFTDSSGTPVNGQAFPGYMMEPYAYGGDDYRVGNYLTYELTIPATAKYFRINNGEENGAYSYKTAITALNDGSTNEKGKGKKNYNNYWCFYSYSDDGAELTTWTANPENTPDMDYKNAEVTSDYDYIYFEKPSTWTGENVYAYFYAGGNLRDDNWQRACYSSWPGVAPAGTEYGDGTTNVYSNTYSIKTTDGTYNGTTTTGDLSPETTINSGTIYKFRIPKGDRTNYSKVIFNDGLKAVSGGDETGVIEYQPGHIYTEKGKATKHYENSPTVLYEASKVENATEYIYVKNTAGWDDLHITFYDANGGQILQQGKGYVMDYAGNSSGDYFKIPLPTDAVKFSVNNGIGNSSVSPLVDIVRLSADGTVKTNAESGDKFAYELTDTTATSGGDIKLTRLNINTTQEEDKTQPTPQEEGFTGYTMIANPETTADVTADPKQIPQVRQTTKNGITTDDTLNIRDMANWNAKIGQISVTFYTSDNKTIGPNVMLKTVADSQNKKWYTKKIPNFSSNPVNAFTVTYIKNDNTYTTPKYPIYPSVPTGGSDGQERTESGCMFFDTQGSGTASTLVMTNVEPAKVGNEVDDETYPKRGDYLYIVNTQNALPLSITFYASGTNVIKSGVKTKYINNVKVSTNNYEYWSKVSIPEGAQSFIIDGVAGMTAQPIYELKSKVSWYEKDYTLGDMQYTFNGTTATCVYPVFTPTPVNKLEISEGHTLTSKVAVLVDEDAIASYQGAAAKLPTTTGGSKPTKEILYNTSNDDVTYSWTVGTASAGSWSSQTLTFTNTVGWSDVWVKFWGTGRSEQNVHMTNQGSNTWTLDLSSYANNTTSKIENVIFHSGQNTWNGSYQTETLTSSNGNLQNSGFGQTFTPTSSMTMPLVIRKNDINGNSGNGQVHAYFWRGNKSNPTNSLTVSNLNSFNWQVGNDNHYGHWVNVPSWFVSGETYVNFWRFEYEGSSENWTSGDLTLTSSYGAYNINSDGSFSSISYVSSWNIGDNITGSFGTGATYSGGTTQTTYKYAYQPEDRYTYITDVSGTTDVNNFIKVTLPSNVTTPYIKFYKANGDDVNTATGTTASTKGLPLNDSSLQLNGSAYTIPNTTGEGTKTYQVRLPKNATKFAIFNDTTAYGDEQDIDVTNFDTTIGNQPVTLDSFRHAGSTFTYTLDGEDNITVSTTLRSGFTPYKTETMTDPLQPMSDADFVFFTDTDGTFANSNKVYAYFYGDVDGEYKAWPGTMATSATSTSAATSYTNNNGKTVYKFRIPKDDNGVYSKVIFTDGASSPKITAAQDIRGGRNYILGSDNSETYGSMTSNVFDVTTEDKTASPSTVNYNSSDNRTIYIINNGTTCNAADETDRTAGGRYILDDMHVEFFTDANGSTPVGTPEGYIPEKVGTHADSTVYRITVPSNAKFFRINNGNGKDNVTDNHNHTRNSEIKPITANGLYKFVTDAKYTKDGSNPTTVAALSTPEYLLTLTNKIDIDGNALTSETYDVHLATIRTGSNGNTSDILWVKDDLDHVDPEYLVDNSSIPVKVKKQGTYYWKEVTPPSGYKLSTNNKVEFTLPANNYQPAEFTNPPIETGSLAITKKRHSVDATNGNTAETGKLFTFTIELNAPVGTVWSQFTTGSVTLERVNINIYKSA